MLNDLGPTEVALIPVRAKDQRGIVKVSGFTASEGLHVWGLARRLLAGSRSRWVPQGSLNVLVAIRSV